MSQQLVTSKVLLAVGLLVVGFVSQAAADPIFGRDRLKFSQQPMIATTVPDDNGTVNTYSGHDELSTAYGFVDAASNTIPRYDGRFMADDFADTLNDPVIHVKWWGSYIKNVSQMPVDKFLISFESDMPAGPAPGFSHPDQPLLNQVVTRGALTPGSGTFTERLIPGTNSVDGPIYEYNAELHLDKPFPEKADTVYWLKIAAMVDVPVNFGQFDPFDPQSSPIDVTQWGWHNRDYTIQDTLASPNVLPGETDQGPFNGVPVWHFQDDAVQGDVHIGVLGPGGLKMPDVVQPFGSMSPTNYIDGIDGPAGPMIPGTPPTPGISRFSKDLAFELYTNNIPEPSSCLLMLLGLAGLATRRR